MLTSRKDAFVNDLRRRLRRRNLDIRSLRHLGAGGSGLATLFEVRSSGSGVRKKFVLKSSNIPDDPVLQYEKSIHMVRMFGNPQFHLKKPPLGTNIYAARGLADS